MKRIFSFVIALVMVLSLVPAVVSAEPSQVVQSPKAGSHAAAGHSDDCGLTSGWQDWTDSTTLPTKGQYVLKTNVDLTGEITLTGDLTLCLNGYVVKAKPWARIIGTNGKTTLTITDCTAYTEDDVYYAGALTGANYTGTSGGAAIFVRQYGTLKLYDGRITDNQLKNDSTATGGGAIMMQDGGSLSGPYFYMYGGEISNNRYYKSNGTTGNNGGAIAVGTYGKVFIEKGTIKDNIGGDGGAIWVKANGELNIKDGMFSGNQGSNGGFVDLVNGAKLTVTGGTFTGNTGYAGAVFHIRAIVAKISGATIEKNTATFGGSAVYVYSSADLTIGDGTVITGNVSNNTDTADGWGAAVVYSSSGGKMTLTGKVYIAGNTVGGKTIGDLNFRRTETDTLYLNNLAEGSYVVFSTCKTKNPAAGDVVSVSGTQSGWNNGWLVHKDEAGNEKHVAYENNAFQFVTGHFHENVQYLPLENADQLIAGGSYYLANETVTLTKEAMLNDGVTLNLCLNGHKLTAKGCRALSTYGGSQPTVINLDDCTAYYDDQGVYHAGAIDGIANAATGAGGGAIFIRTNGTLNMFNGKISNNTSKVGGGAMQINGTVNIHDGLFYKNQASGKDGGAILVSTGGKLTMTGGSFVENSGNNGGAILANGPVSLENVTITGNTAKYAAAIGIQHNSANLSLKNVTITDNLSTASDWCGVNIQNNAAITLAGKVIIQNNLNGSGKQQNIYLCKGVSGVDATDLTDGSQIGITLRGDRISAGQMQFTTGIGEKTYFFSDDSAYQVDVNGENKLCLTKATAPVPAHQHKPCKDSGCASHAAIQYKAWDDPTKLPADGNWYLTTDVAVSASTSVSATLNLCLNGHNIQGYTGSGARIFETTGKGGALITLTDCKAENAGGVYKAGALTGSHNTQTNAGGGAIFIRTGDTMEIFEGIISNNSSAAGGGAIQVTGTMIVHNAQICDNKAPGKDAGAIYVISGGLLKMTGGSIQNNQANNGGGLMINGTAHLENVTITGNSGKYAAAFGIQDNSANVTLKNVTITGNNITGQAWGGINYQNNGILKLEGKVVIRDNMTAAGTQQNLYLCKGVRGADVAGLTEGSQIGIALREDRISAGQMYFSTNLANADYFTSDDETYVVGVADGKMILKPSFVHIHCQCGKTDCTDSAHKQISYEAWTNSKDLPTSGSYCLLTDVTLSGEKTLSADLDLCLHGHKITRSSGRVLSTNGVATVTVNVADCQGGGSITGNERSANTGGGAIFVRAKGTVNWYGGNIENSASAAGGGAVLVTGTFNLYGGKISGSKAVSADGSWKDAGAFYMNSGSVMNIYGGEITGSQGARGSAIYVNNASLNIYGGKISGNEAKSQGAIFGSAGSKIRISGAPEILGNTAGSGASNVVLTSGQKLQLEDLSRDARIAVSGLAFSVISEPCEDYSTSFISDNTSFQVIHKDGALYLEAAGDHKHCLCTGATTQGCDHTQQLFAAWTDPKSLPTSGNYYLDVDVTVADQIRLTGGTLNLCLNGHTISVAENGNRVFYVRNDVVLNITDCASNMGKITGAKSSAIMFDIGCNGAVLNLYRGAFSGNRSSAAGGAIIIQGKGTFNMYGGLIQNNVSESELVLDSNGQPALDENGSQKVTSSFGGGGVAIYGADTTFNLYGGQIRNNQARNVTYLNEKGEEVQTAGSGGGVYVRGTMNLYGGQISNNTAEQGGGLMVVTAGGKLNIYGGQISGNYARAGGGFISQTNSVVNMYDGLITENKTGVTGGAGAYISINTTFNMEGGSIVKNYAPNGGAGLYIYRGKVNLNDGLISENTTAKDGNGGGIFVAGEGGLLTMNGGTVSKNESQHGAGILVQSRGEFRLNGGRVTGNRATKAGGGIYISINTNFTMTGGEITSNWTKGNGGGLSLYRCKAKISGGSISYNQGYIAGVHVIGANATFTGTSFVGNACIDKGHGGAMAVSSTSYVENGVVKDQYSYCVVSGCYMANNTAEHGAAVIVMSKGTQFYMYGGTVIGNKAVNGGGGMYLSSNTSCTLSGVKVLNNSAKEGGGISTFRCSANMDNLLVQGNSATGYGGGIAVRGVFEGSDTINIKDSTITQNISSGGGGIIVVHYMTMNMDNCQVTDNASSGSAGGIYNLYQSVSHVSNSTISGNTSGMSGGGIVNTLANWTTLRNTVIENNIAGKHGGAVYNRCRLEIYDCTLQNNSAVENGGAIGTESTSNELSGSGSGVYLQDVKILSNRCGMQGGGIYLSLGCPNRLMKNVIFTGNTSDLEGSAIYSESDLKMEDVEATGNCSKYIGYAVYLADSHFDGQGYFNGHKQMTGRMIIKDNEGGDLYLGEQTAMAVTGQGLHEDACVRVTLHSGVLTQRVFGQYDYEGGDLEYTITCGDRSIREPEVFAEPDASGQQKAETGNVWLYVGVGIFAVAAVAAILLISKKKKKDPTGVNKV